MADKTMKVFKFGGASLQNVENIRRVVAIIKQQNKKDDSLLIVVSAAGKSTTLLENILALWLNHDATASELFQQNIVRYYEGLLSGYRNGLKPEEAFQKLINEAISYLENPAPDDENLAYDMLVSYGELLTSLLLVQLLQSEGITIEWEDARKLFRTDRNYRDASIDWQQSQANIELLLSKKLKHSLVLTQGFIASDDLGKSTTLGREGSDYSAAIFASILDAKSVTVWKDVPGVMTADPSIYPHAVLIDRLSYRDAIEMTFYGAKIIHPKTLQPLENKQIPLFVKSFLQPEAAGTHVCHLESGRKKLAPICVTKPQQVFFQLSTTDLSFVSEWHLGIIYTHFARHRIKLNMARVTAVSFDACFDYTPATFEVMKLALSKSFDIKTIHELDLLTFIEYNADAIEAIRQAHEVVLEEKNERVAQLLIRP